MSEAAYPEHWEADVVLRDGSTCRIRPVRPDDRECLEQFYQDLSDETRYTRFFAVSPELGTRDMERILTADHRSRIALIAWANDRIIGVGTADSIGRAEAEIAFIVADDQQGRGLGSVLLEHLAAVSRESGIHRFKAEVLSGNKRMLSTFAAAGYSPSQELEEGVYQLDFDIDPTHKSRSVARSREHRAESLSIRRLLTPHVVAVVTDADHAGVAADLVANLHGGHFVGRVVVVSPDGASFQETAGFRSLRDVPFRVDLAVIAATADAVEDLIDECADCGVHGIVLLSGGFIHNDEYTRQHALTQRIRMRGMRLLGPAALGLINTDPAVSLNASLVPDMPPRGRIGFFSQTGAFGTAILSEAQRRGLGVSVFVSAGNRADVSGNDLLQFWEDDDATNLVLLYLESIGNPRKFTRIARRMARVKPIVAVRSGRSTQALPLGREVRRTDLSAEAIDAIFEQAGVIQVDSLTELLDLAALLAFQPLPAGDNVGFITDSDALGVLSIDASSSLGLQPVGPATIADPSTDPVGFEKAITEMVTNPAVDAVVISHVPPVRGDDSQFGQVVTRVAANSTKPILAVLLAGQNEPLVPAAFADRLPGHGSVPVFSDVEGALRALRSVVRYHEWLVAPRGRVPRSADLERQRAHELAVSAVDSLEDVGGSQRLASAVIIEILASYGIDVWPAIPVDSEEAAVAAAEQVGYPVVLKTTFADYEHRVDLGGIRLSLENEASLRTAFMSMTATLGADALAQLVVQRMAPNGVACVAATTEDPLFGPVISFRMGGHLPELLGDVSYRIPPITDEEARRLIRKPKSAHVLFPTDDPKARVHESLDTAALEDLITRLAQLADDVPEIAALELNPIVVHEHGVAVLGASGTVARPLARTDLEARRLL